MIGTSRKQVICDHAGKCERAICEHKHPHAEYIDHDLFECGPDVCGALDTVVYCIEVTDDNR